MYLAFSELSMVSLAYGRMINKDNYIWVIIGALVVVFGFIFSLAFGVWFMRRKRQLRMLKALTDNLDLEFFCKGRRNETDWMIGKVQGFDLTMHGRTVTLRGVFGGTNTRRVNYYVIRLILSIPGISSPDLNIYRRLNDQVSDRNRGFADFEEVFSNRKGMELLSEELKDSLIEFASEHRGSLLLGEPRQVRRGHLPEGRFSDESMLLLTHDAFMHEIKDDTEKLRKVLDDLVVVAEKIRRGVKKAPSDKSE